MSNLDRHRDHPSRSPLLHPRAQSPEPGGHVCAEAETREAATIRTLLLCRREGEFVGAEDMDAGLKAMIANKRRAHGHPS